MIDARLRRSPRSARGSTGSRTIICAAPLGDAYAIHEATLRGETVVTVTDIGSAPLAVRTNGRARAVANAEVVLALPRRDVIIRYIRVPTKNAAEVARMAPYEASLHSPWLVTESVIGYEVQYSDDEGYTTAALYIARRAVVEGHVARLGAAGLQVTRVEPSTRCYAALLRTVEDTERPALLAVNEDGAEFVRLAAGNHEFSRGAGRDEDPMEMLARCLDLDAKRLGGESCTSLIVAGDDETQHRAVPDRARTIAVSAARFGAVQETAVLDAHSALAAGAALTAHTAAATSNLLPEAQQRSLHTRSLVSHARRLAVLFLWLAAVVIAAGYIFYYIELRRAVAAEREIAALRPSAGDLKAQKTALDMLARDRREASTPLRLVLDLYDRAPQDIAISTFRYDSRGGVTLGGETQQFQSIYKLLDALKQSELLQDIRLTNSAKPRSGQNAVVEYKITARMRQHD